MSSADFFPLELTKKPLALIGLSGLDIQNNLTHKNIWEQFTNNRRNERTPIQFKILESGHQFPQLKPKRSSYDWYIPKGILKTNWINKHLNEIPAVIVIFFELEWDDAQWNEKKMQFVYLIQDIKRNLEGRNTRLAVTLIQQTPPLPTGEDLFAAERAAALCSSCDLNTKSLFVLPQGDHLQGYTLRLENAFYELAQNYYHLETKNIKIHRDHLNKTTHHYLFVRHQFKMGFLNELKQDRQAASTHYLQAYSHLLELRIVDTNILEIKIVAGMINYKLCKLMFQLSLARDSITQFLKHIEWFKSRTGPKELTFEHHAWVSKQFSLFADVFDEAIRQGLPAIQTQHPGFYYQMAATHLLERKRVAEQIQIDTTTTIQPNPLEGHIEFYGQRPWRPGKLSAEPPDPTLERLAMTALQSQEKQVNHCMLVISQYSNSISQFKKYRCPRMRRQLVVQMAEEYYSARDYGKALTLFTHMISDYRTERWWLLLSNILNRALKCAYLTANIQDFIILAFESLSRSIINVDKETILANLLQVLDQQSPDEPKGLKLPDEDLNRARELWNQAAQNDQIIIEAANILSCIECKGRFIKNKFEAEENVQIEIFIRSRCIMGIEFTKLSVTMNSANATNEFAVNADLFFNANEVKRFVCEWKPDIKDIGHDVQLAAILLHLEGKKRVAILKFAGISDSNVPSAQNNSSLELSFLGKNDFDAITPLAIAQIIPRSSKVSFTPHFQEPALLGEWFPIRLSLTNQESSSICNVSFEITLISNPEDLSIEQATQICIDTNRELVSFPLKLSLGNLELNQGREKKFFLRAHRVGNRNINIKISYTLLDTTVKDSNSEPVAASCVSEHQLTIPVVIPFDVTAKFTTMKFDSISKAFAREPFLLMPNVSCLSPFPLEIIDSTVELSQHARMVDASPSISQLQGVCLARGEIGAEALSIQVPEASEQPVALGIYTLQWRRARNESSTKEMNELSSFLTTSSSVTMPTIQVDPAPLYIEMTAPPHGWVHTPMPVAYQLYNRTNGLLQIDLVMDANDAFMFAGHKQLQLKILPESVKTLNYNLYPLLSGLVALPKLRLSLEDPRQIQLADLLDRSTPSHVYVMPQGKGNGNPSSIRVS